MARLRIKNAFFGIVALVVMITSVPAGARGCLDALSHELNDALDRHVSDSHHDHKGEVVASHGVHTTAVAAPHQRHVHKHRHAPTEKEHEHTHQQTFGANVMTQAAIAPAAASSTLRTVMPAPLITIFLLKPVSESSSVVFRPPIFS